MPFFIFAEIAKSVGLMLVVAVVIIFFVSAYSAKAHQRSFVKELGLMLLFSLGVASITFAIGQILKRVIGIEV